ncbi:hypothetical protein [Georgenia thermotolerans]|nr:hypothetical protein [Georgenia thermotolerans]
MSMRGRWQVGLVLALAVCAPLLLALVSGAATVHCVPVPGGWTQAGLTLALLGPDEACPYGSLAVGATTGQVLTVVVAVAVPAVLAHLALLTGAAGVLGAARSVVVAAARRLIRRLRPGPVRLPVRPRLAVVLGAAFAPLPREAWRRPHRRGPPQVACARS